MAKLKQNPDVKSKFKSYPTEAKKKLEQMRTLIIETANEIDSITELEETLKWGEPSYLAKKGSTIRLDWKEKKPDQVAIYFKCTSKLVSTFKEVYGNTFNYETTRAIVFKMDENIPETELKQCIASALQYHLLKDKPLLDLKG